MAKVETDSRNAELNDAELDAVSGGSPSIGNVPINIVAQREAHDAGRGNNPSTGSFYLTFDVKNVGVSAVNWGSG
jgi:hypothetical protein